MPQDSGTSWAKEEFGGASLGDARLVHRRVRIAQKLGEAPTASIPQACSAWDQMKGACRFFDNHRVDQDQILAPHFRASQERVRGRAVVLAVQDSTQFDFTHHPATTGLGLTQDQQHQGLFYHPTLLLTPERAALGLAHQQVWTRPPEDFGKKHRRKQRPIQAKESSKWLHSLSATARLSWRCASAPSPANRPASATGKKTWRP